ncbi:hypothetical protein Tco_1570942 [Tanacetum coccineum]
MENEHELSYETLTRVYLGSYEHYKGVLEGMKLIEPGFELQGAKMVEMGRFGIIREQRIATYKGYRGGCVVQVRMSTYGVYLYPFEGVESKQGFMKWVLDDPSYVTGGEPKYPQELFSAVDLLSLQFLASMVSFERISPNSFLSSIMLVVVIIVTVVIVVVILIVVVVAIVGVIIVVVIFGVVVVVDGVSLIFQFSFMIIVRGQYLLVKSSFKSVQVILLACSILIGWAYAFHQDKASLDRVLVANVTLSSSAHLLRENTNSVRSNQRMRNFSRSVFLLKLLEFAMAAACAFRAKEMPSLISCRMASKVMAGVSDVDGYGMIHEDGDNDAFGGNDDEREIIEEEDGEQICFLGGNSSSGTKKYRGSNSSDGGNTGDGVKIADGVIGSGDGIGFSLRLIAC